MVVYCDGFTIAIVLILLPSRDGPYVLYPCIWGGFLMDGTMRI